MGNIYYSKRLKKKLMDIHSRDKQLPKLIESDDINDQSIDDYYIKLKMICIPKEDNNKQKKMKLGNNEEILEPKDQMDLNMIFSNKPSGRVLVLGKAGVGKTSLMHYISYKWSMNQLWRDDFEYVFRVRLKDLNIDWENDYKTELENFSEADLFSCFLHNSLRIGKKKIKDLNKLKYFLQPNKSKILLLVDGYDEIQYLLGTESVKRKNANLIINEIKTYPNFIMTSRPNAVPDNFFKENQGKFDTVIENIGLDDEGIRQYVRNFFKNKKNQDSEISLVQFLEGNRDIKNICCVPINTIMICLIWQDVKIQEKLKKGLTITKLYEEMVIMLGKRYLKKWEQKDDNYVADLNLYNLFENPVACSIKKIAYEGFKTEGLVIEGKTICETLNTQNKKGNTKIKINDIVNFGLTVAGKGKTDLTKRVAEIGRIELSKQNHQFIHLTFQEFLTAIYFKEQLQSDVEFAEAQKEIIYGKSKARYLMVLKFLAGLVSKDGKGLEKFWEAILISKDGQIEFGGKEQVDLLAHLLSQSLDSEEKINQKIPKKIQQYVDTNVVNNIGAWSKTIIDSGYKPDNIVELIKEKLNSRDNNIVLETISILDIFGFKNKDAITCLKNKIDEQILQKIPNLHILTELINAIGNIGIDSKESDEILIKLIDDYNNNEAILIASVVALTKSFNIENLDRVTQYLKDILSKNNSFAIQPLIEGLTKICSKEKKGEIIMLIKKHLDNNLLNGEIALYIVESLERLGTPKIDIIDELINILKSGQITKQIYAAKALGNIGKSSKAATKALIKELTKIRVININEELEQTILISLGKIGGTTNITLLNPFTKKYKYYIKKGQKINLKNFTNSIGKIAKSNPSIAKEGLELLMLILTDKNNKVQSEASQALGEIVKSDPSLAGQGLELIQPLLADSDLCVRKSASQTLGEIVKSDPSLAVKGLEHFKLLVADNKSCVRKLATQALGEIVKSNPSLSSMGLQLIQPLLADIDWCVRKSASQAIRQIVKSDPSFAGQSLGLIIPLVVYNDNDVRKSAYQVLREIVKSDPSLADQGLQLIKPFIEHTYNYVRSSASQAVAEIVKFDSSWAGQGLQLIIPLLVDSKSDVRLQATQSLGEIVKSDPSLASKGLELYKPLLSDINIDVRKLAFINFLEIFKSDPSLAVKGLEHFKLLMADNNSGVRKSASQAFVEIMKSNPSLSSMGLNILKHLIADKNTIVKDSASQVLAEIVKFNSSLVVQVLELLKSLMEDSDGDVRKSASQVLRNVLKSDSSLAGMGLELIQHQNADSKIYLKISEYNLILEKMKFDLSFAGKDLELLKPLIANSKIDVRQSAYKDLVMIIQSDPSLAGQGLELIQSLLTDSDWRIRKSASQVLGEIVKSDPSLAVKGLEHFKLLVADNNSCVRKLATQALGEIVKSDPSLAGQGLELIQPLLADSDLCVRKSASQTLGEIVKSDPSMAVKGLQLFKLLLSDSNIDVRISALKDLIDIVKSDSSLAGNSLELIQPLLRDQRLRKLASQSLGEIIKINSSLGVKGLKYFKHLLSDSDIDVRNSSFKYLVEIVKSDPSLAGNSLELIQPLFLDQISHVKKLASQSLGEIIKINSSLAVKGLELIKHLLSDSDSSIRKLATKTFISIQCDYISIFIQNEWIFTRLIDDLDFIEDKKDVKQVISLMAKNLTQLPKVILEKLINILNDKYKYEAQFIKKQFNFLEYHKLNNLGEICELLEKFQKEDNFDKNLLTCIIDYGIKFEKNQDDNILLKINEEEVARKDESYCFKLLSSLEEKSKELKKPLLIYFPFKENQAFSIVRSDSMLEFDKYHVTIIRQENSHTDFIYSAIFETTNLFREKKIHKITNASFKSYKSINEDIKKEIFQGVDVVYAKCFTLQGCEKIKSFMSKSESKGISLENLLDFINNVDENIKIVLDLKTYIENSDILTSEELIGYTKIERRIAQVEERVDTIEKNFEQLKEELNRILEERENDINKYNEKMVDAKELEYILNNSYNKQFFYCFVKTLNASWMAANIVSNTNIIKNNKKGINSYIAGFIKFSTDRIPIIGSGIKLFGLILKAVDETKQENMVSLLDKFAKDDKEMDDFSRKLAIKILSHGVDQKTLSQPDQLIERCSKWLQYAKQSLVYIIESHPDDKKDDEIEILGQQHGSRAAKIVISKIYEGQFGLDRFGELESFVKEAFGKNSNENDIMVGVEGAQDYEDSKYVQSGFQILSEI